MSNYKDATDSESGTIEAANFADACRKLNQIVTPAAIANGGWGWVEDVDGDRYEVGSR